MAHKQIGSVGKKLWQSEKDRRIAQYREYIEKDYAEVEVAWLLAVRAFGIEKANEMFDENGTGSTEGRD